MANPLTRVFRLRSLRKIRSAVIDWSLGECTKSALSKLGAIKEIGIALPLLLVSPESADVPQGLDDAAKHPATVKPLIAKRTSRVDLVAPQFFA